MFVYTVTAKIENRDVEVKEFETFYQAHSYVERLMRRGINLELRIDTLRK